MNRFLKLFIMMGFPYGVIMGLYLHNAVQGIARGLLFGLCMALAFRLIEKFSFKKMGIKDGMIDVVQEKKFYINDSKDKVAEKIKKTFYQMNTKIFKDDGANGIIRAKTRISLKSFGEIMTVRFTEVSGQTEIFVESRPSIATTMVDYGKNLINVQTFEKIIMSF